MGSFFLNGYWDKKNRRPANSWQVVQQVLGALALMETKQTKTSSYEANINFELKQNQNKGE